MDIPVNVDSREIPNGYVAKRLGKGNNPNLTFFRKHPKLAKGKAAVKRAKRERQRTRTRPHVEIIAA